MRDRLQAWLTTIVEKWKGLTKSQKIKVAAIAGVVLLALIFTLILTLRTVWAPAFAPEDAPTSAAIRQVLDAEGIRNRVDNTTGRILVPRDEVGDAQLAAQHAPSLADPSFTFREVIDASGMGVTGTLQHAMLNEALQTSLQNRIRTFNGIDYASVTLTVPNTPMLLRPIAPSSAGVIIGGSNITPEMGRTIATLVMRAVPGLSLDRVSVMDTNFNMLFNDGEMQGGFGGGSNFTATISAAARSTTEQQVQSLFSPIFSEVRVAGNIRVNMSESISELLTHINPYENGGQEGFVNRRSFHDIMAILLGDGTAIEPGLMPNGFPGAPLMGENAEGATVLTDMQAVLDFLYDTFFERSINPAGNILWEDSTLGVTAFNHIVHVQQDLVTRGVIEEGELAWLEWQAEHGNAPVRVPEAFEGEFDDYIAMIAVATSIPAVNLQFMLFDQHHFEGIITTPLPLTQIILLALTVIFVALLVFGLIRRAQPQPIDDIEPELSVEDLLVSTQLDTALEAEMSEAERIAQIRHEQDSAVKEQIDKFATEKPESVAQLLRNWINEDWD